jgi:hypothetical protein
MSVARSIGRSPIWQAAALYAVMTAVVLYPIITVQVPALCDYLNHLARMHILADIDRSEALSRLYRVHWQAIPYLAMDASFVVLDHIASIYNAGRIFVAISVILPVISVATLHFSVHRKLSLVPLTAFLLCYNYVLSWGFMIYLPSLCLAVILFAGWISSVRWRRWPRAAVFCSLAPILYLSHLVAFGAYCLAVGGFELGQACRTGFRPWRTIAGNWLVAALQSIPALVIALTVDVERPFVGPLPTSFGDLNIRFVSLVSPVLFSGGVTDMLAAGFAVLVLYVGFRTGRLRLAPAVWPAVLATGVVAACMPHWLLGTFNMDVRLPLMAAMLLIGAISTTERLSRSLGCCVLGGFLLLATIRSVGIASALGTLDTQIAEVRQVVSAMPRGMRLLLVDTSEGTGPLPPWATSHVGMVAVIDRDAFVPNLFTGLGTVRPAPDLRAASTPNGAPLNLSELADGLGRRDDPADEEADGRGGRIYWLGWETKFDYVLALHFDSSSPAMPSILQPAATSSVADLYRINKTVSR